MDRGAKFGTVIGAREAATDPAWLPHSFDASGENLIFLRVPREARRSLPFLWDEHFGGRFEKRAWAAAELELHASEAPSAPLRFVFHTAFCGSTLLTRALEALAPVSALKEPALPNNLAHRILNSGAAAENGRLLLALRLLSRPFPGEAAVIVKPTNFAGPIAGAMLRGAPDSRAILLHSDLRTFLATVARRGLGGRTWGRQLFAYYRRATPLDFGYSPAQLLEHTDLQAAALGWLMQMLHLRGAARDAGRERALAFAFAELKANPAATLSAAAGFLGIDAAPAAVEAVAAGEVFRTHSKRPGALWNASAEDAALAVPALAEEVEMVAAWAEAVAARFRLPLTPAER
jgi:hypothetical protein